MDLTRPVTYRGLTLTGAAGGPGGDNPMTGMRLTRAQLTDVPTVGYVEKRSLDRGLDASDVYLAGRNITLTGEVFGENKAEFFDFLDVLRVKFTASDAYRENPAAQGYLPLAFSQPTLLTTHWPTGIITRAIDVRPLTQGEYDTIFGALGEKAPRGYVVPFTVAMQAKDPLFYHPVPQALTIDGTGQTEQLVNRGNVPVPMYFSIDLPGSAVDITWTDSESRTLVLNVPAVSGTLTIDSFGKVARIDGSVDMSVVATSSEWPMVMPTDEGATDDHIWASTVALAAPSQVVWSEAWA